MERSTLGTCIAVTALLGLGALAARAVDAADAPASAPEVSIPFANHGGIFNWVTDRDRGLWVQDVHRRWYYAKLMGPCTGLTFVTALRFDTRPNDQLDRFSAIMVPGQGRAGRCPIVSVVTSDGPPRATKTPAATPAPAPAPQGAAH